VEGGVEHITQNFRSVAPLLAWVNRVFTEVIVEDTEEHSQPAYVPIEPAHPAHAGLDRPALVLLPLSPPDDERSAGDLRRAEAEAIAAVACRAVEDGWPVHGAHGEPERRATYADIAVLFPTTSGLDLYEEAFAAAGVPYRFEGGRLFYQRQEVRDLTQCVAAVDDPTDELAVVAALKSSAFAVADERLYLFRTAGGRFNPLSPVPAGHAAIARAFTLLRELHAERNRRGIGAMVEEILARTRLAEVNLPRADGRQAVANLWKVAEQAHAFDRRTGATFRAFARWLAQNQERTPREVESPAIEEGEPVVRMLTVHAAKGLEFPIVVLANLGARRSRAETWIVDRAANRVAFRLGEHDSGWRTADYTEAVEREQRHAAAEDRRLLYVACTRARDHLVLPLAPAADGSLAACLASALPPASDVTGGCVIGDQFVYDAGLLGTVSEDGPADRR
jgi:ATP-dependent exoDNAse (exonuclease V) beta subunit